MKNMRIKQRGIGALGWISILGVLAFFVLTALRIFPLYTEKFSVIAAMKSVAKLPNVEELSKTDVRRSFQKNVEINSNSIRFSADKALKNLVNVVTDKKTKKRYIHVSYEGRNEYIKDIKFLLEFDHKVELGGSGGE